MMLKLKLQDFGHFIRRVDSLEKTLMLGGIGGRRRRGRQRLRWLDGITDSMDVSLRTPGVGDGQGDWCAAIHGVAESDTTEWLNWTELKVVTIVLHAYGLSLCARMVKLFQSCPTVWHPTDCSPAGSSVHGILQARILKRTAMTSSRGSSRPRDQTHVSYVSCIGRQVLYH